MALVLQVREDLAARPVGRVRLRDLIARAEHEHGAEIVRMARDRVPPVLIAELTGTPVTTVYGTLQRAGISTPRPTFYGRVRGILDECGPALIAAYQDGRALSPLAAAVGISPITLGRFLESQGIALRDDRRRPPA